MAEMSECELYDSAAVLGARFRGADSCLLADANGNLDPEAPPANYGRRRSRAVLYQLSGHYKQDKIKTKLKLNNLAAVALMQMEFAEFHPYTPTHREFVDTFGHNNRAELQKFAAVCCNE
ncbi:hypothetical protein QE152_g15679 [Popillia japonica]|uniref:Uncharacterized protein n=1 Tax=Popillia japonica TaxID=7064 RepID=A0AAW1L6D8_POPJA